MSPTLMKRFGFTGLALLMLVVLVGLKAFAYTPEALYDDAWRFINTRFVDEDKNGQYWGIWRHRYDREIEDQEDAYIAIRTMLASLNDRYTRFLDPEEYADETRSIQAELMGIGVQIGNRDGKLVVISPIEDTPAFKAGLMADDEILKIDAVDAKGMDVKDAADLIRGKRGTEVKLLVRRKEKNTWYSITRDKIDIKAISDEPIFNKEGAVVSVPDDVGYIRLSTFLSRKASYEMRDILAQQKDKGAYIIDLRSNPGGLLSNAITIADFFLKGHAIVSTVDRDGYKDVRYARDRQLVEKPLVLLINKGSASASEILSGALRDNSRAVLVGETSFGKGLVQEINPLPGGTAMNITTQRYLTPNDTDINKTGIVPDIEVKLGEEEFKAKNDVQLAKAIEVAQKMIAGESIKTFQHQRARISRKR